jgi:hypothetical protein
MKFSPLGLSVARAIEQNPSVANSLELFLTISLETIPSDSMVR